MLAYSYILELYIRKMMYEITLTLNFLIHLGIIYYYDTNLFK